MKLIQELIEGFTETFAEFKKETDSMKPGTTTYVGRKNGKEIHAKKDLQGNVKFYYKDGIRGQLKLFTEGLADRMFGAPPRVPKYRVGQVVSYETDPPQPDWKDKGRGVGRIKKVLSDGHYEINGNLVNHFEIKSVVKEGFDEKKKKVTYTDDEFSDDMGKFKKKMDKVKWWAVQTDGKKFAVYGKTEEDAKKEYLRRGYKDSELKRLDKAAASS